jgi:hypothetical protein
MSQVYTYDLKKVSVIAAGRITTGFPEDGVVTVTYNEDRVSATVGVKGDVIYTENADNSATAAITIMHTSPSYKHYEDLCAKRVFFRFDVADANADGGFRISEENCRVLKMPDKPRTSEPTAITINVFIPDCNVR